MILLGIKLSAWNILDNLGFEYSLYSKDKGSILQSERGLERALEGREVEKEMIFGKWEVREYLEGEGKNLREVDFERVLRRWKDFE